MKYVLPLILVYVMTLSDCMDSSSLDYIVDPETRQELIRPDFGTASDDVSPEAQAAL